MSWLKKRSDTASSKKASEEEELIASFNDGSEQDWEYADNIAIYRELSEMKASQEAREKEEQALEDRLVVIEGAKIKFNSHMGEFKVLNDVPTTQDKLTGTIVENIAGNFTFYDGFELLTITGGWQDYGSYKVQDNEVLIKKSMLAATGKMPGNSAPETGNIVFVDSGQINVPEGINASGAPMPAGVDDDRKITSMSWCYGEDNVPLTEESRYYVDMNLIVDTVNYEAGEKICIGICAEDEEAIADGLTELVLTGTVDENNQIIFKEPLKNYTLYLINEDHSEIENDRV